MALTTRAGTLVGLPTIALCCAFIMVASAHGDTATALEVEVRQEVAFDGLPNWDSVDAPGFDTGPSNGRVRVGDEIGFRWSVMATRSSRPIELTARASAGLTWSSLPDECDPDASAIDGDVLTCVLPPHPHEALALTAVARVDRSVPEGSRLSATVSTGASTATNTVAATAGPRFDLSMGEAVFRGVVESPDGRQGGLYDHTIEIRHRTPAGRSTDDLWNRTLGLAPLADRFALTIDLADHAPGVRLADWLPQLRGGCHPNGLVSEHTDFLVPYSSIGLVPGATAANSAPDSGSWACSQRGSTISVWVEGAITDGASLPTHAPSTEIV